MPTSHPRHSITETPALHYDGDFERLAANTDLAVTVQALAPLGSLP